MIDILRLSWRKGGDSPTATELNKLVAKINEIVGEANNGFVTTGGGNSSFDWSTIPSASINSRGLMTPEQVDMLNNVRTPSLETLTGVLGDYYIKTEYKLAEKSKYTTSDQYVPSAWYVNEYFVNWEYFNEWKKTIPTLSGDNIFTGNNSFTGHTFFTELALGDVTVKEIHDSKDAPDGSDEALVTDGHVKTHYLRGDKGIWTANGDYTFTSSVVLGQEAYIQTLEYNDDDFLGWGVGIFSQDGHGYIKTDNLVVRNTAWLRSVTIEETKHIGGETILSCAYCIIAEVVPFTYNKKNYFACFFDKKKNGKEAYQMWEVGDQARLQQTKVGASASGTSSDGSQSLVSRFYWRVVTDCGDGEMIGGNYPELYGESKIFGEWCKEFFYVVLSDNKDEDLGVGYVRASGVYSGLGGKLCEPAVNDEIVLLGNRNLDPQRNYRRAAQLYSTADTSSSPLRRYYTGIGLVQKDGKYQPFSLEGCEVEKMEFDHRVGTLWKVGHGDTFLQYSDEHGLEAHLNKLEILVNGNATDVAEVIDGGFKIWIYPEVDWSAPLNGDEPVSFISWNYNKPSSVWISDQEKQAHVGDYLVTTDGFSYEFRHESNQYGWYITTDRYLVHAQAIANESKRVLGNMASDNIITAQEKIALKRLFDTLDNEHKFIVEEALACNVGTNEEPLEDFEMKFKFFKSMLLNVLSNMKGDTILVREDGLVLCASEDVKPLAGSVISTDYMADTEDSYTFSECYTNYYDAYNNLRKLISETTFSIGSDVADLSHDLEDLGKRLEGTSGAFQLLDEHLASIGVKGDDGKYSGLLAKKDVAALFAKDGDVEATIAAYVQEGISGARITADQIEMNGNLGVQGLTYRIATNLQSVDADKNGVYEGMHREFPIVPTNETEFKFFRVGIYQQAGVLGTEAGATDAYALNLAKTGSFITLNTLPNTEGLFNFVLPCLINTNKVYNRFAYSEKGMIAIERAKVITDFFRKQALKYLGNTIVMEIPPSININVQFDCSEYSDGTYPVRVNKGFKVYEGGLSEGFPDIQNGVYTGNSFLDVETAWLAPSQSTRYVIMELKRFKNEKRYNVPITIEDDKKDIIGWELTLFDGYYQLTNK